LRPDHADGAFDLFAPTLRCHDGTFFVACTNTAPTDPAAGRAGGTVSNFIVHTDDPAGEWSDAAWVDRGGFDPSLTFDGDTCYYTRRSLTFANTVAGPGPIVQAEVDPFTGALAADPAPITPGLSGFASNDIEGPHLYRIGEWYYLFAAEGGTEKGHMQTCARSRSPWGPFEPAPHNPILSHRHLVAHPIQRTGHAELIDAPDGSWWALFLATREDRMQGPQILGRETFLAPVRWRNGWPVIGDDGVVGVELEAPRLPLAGQRSSAVSPWLAGWSTRQSPRPGLAIDARSGTVELPIGRATLDDSGPVSAAFLRQCEHRASFAATVAEHTPPGVAVGITAYTAPEHHFDLYVSSVDGARRAADLVAEQTVGLPDAGPVRLVMECDGAEYRFTAGDTTVGTGSARLLDADLAPGVGSVRLGVSATGGYQGRILLGEISVQNVG
jgi:xylan 1,4-beta-xylosidase